MGFERWSWHPVHGACQTAEKAAGPGPSPGACGTALTRLRGPDSAPQVSGHRSRQGSAHAHHLSHSHSECRVLSVSWWEGCPAGSIARPPTRCANAQASLPEAQGPSLIPLMQEWETTPRPGPRCANLACQAPSSPCAQANMVCGGSSQPEEAGDVSQTC